MTKTTVYMDYSATTPVRPEVAAAMEPYLSESFGNPSSLYELGQRSRAAIEDAREKVAASIGAHPEEIVFTGGGTESDNQCVLETAEAFESRGKHIVSTEFEHHAVIEPIEYLVEKRGCSATFVKPPGDGVITPELVEEAMRPDTILVSVLTVNNEVGTVQPIGEIAKVVHARGALMHSDAVQALGKVPVDVRGSGIDMLSFSAHKLYGPKGVGATFIRKGLEIPPLLRGGGQERGLRSGTQNVPGIVGFAEAARLAVAELPSEMPRLRALRDRLFHGLMDRIPEMYLNGDEDMRSPGNMNVILRGVEGESLLLLLDREGIAVSTGSACSSGSPKPSHVLLAIGVPEEDAHGSMRCVLGRPSTDADVDVMLEKLPAVVDKLRSMSPYWREICRGAGIVD